ncbi:MAG: PFL family protein [Candidatus Sumerlaeota bacterium]|nr:PFL family protein [Candidatus Sumerlaeota bacterium]
MGVFTTEEIMRTVEMIHKENLDVRTVTLGINLLDCADQDAHHLQERVHRKIVEKARRLVPVCEDVSHRYGIPIVNKRISLSPVSQLLEAHDEVTAIALAKTIERAAREVNVDFVGGFSALVEKGWTHGAKNLIDAIPMVLSSTERVCSSVNVASTAAGINVDAVKRMAEAIIETACLSADRNGLGAAKLVVFANIPADNPFMAGAYLGAGEPECVVNIGVSGPGVVKRALEVQIKSRKMTFTDIAEEIKKTAFRVTRVGELIGREVAERLGVQFGIVDLSLAPTPRIGDSVGEILQTLGIEAIGAPGSTAAIALLNDAVKKGGLFASSSVGGLSGAFMPVSEDAALSEAARRGDLRLEKLEAMTSVCSVGLDMVAVPGDTDASTLAAIILDEMAIGVINNKTTACRIIPVPGKKAGEKAVFGGLFGETYIMPVHRAGASRAFIEFGGRIPAPLRGLKN